MITEKKKVYELKIGDKMVYCDTTFVKVSYNRHLRISEFAKDGDFGIRFTISDYDTIDKLI